MTIKMHEKNFFYIKARESCPVSKNMHTLLYISNLIFLMYFLAVFQMCIGICFTFAYQTIKESLENYLLI